jgi:hypothetical protein
VWFVLFVIVTIATSTGGYAISKYLGAGEVNEISIWMSCAMWWLAIMWIRNWHVETVRLAMLDRNLADTKDMRLANALYETLPPVDVMIMSPRHWHRWTFEQWRAYAYRHLPIVVVAPDGTEIEIPVKRRRRK